MMIKKAVWVFFSMMLLFSCNKTYEKAMKSKEPEFILNAADELYDSEKWPYAIELYQKVSSAYAGTQQAEHINYRSAYANFYDKNYVLSARQFKNFYTANLRSEKAEEALFMSAYSYYMGSPKYNLDQTNTYEAIRELQGFIDAYPTSNRVKDANKYINELQQKLERKAFEIAQSYHKTLKFQAASVSFANFLDDFPDSKLREEAFMYMLRARAELGLQSVFSKKENRLKDALTTYRLFTQTYPNSKFSKEANDLHQKIEKELQTHATLVAQLKEEKK